MPRKKREFYEGGIYHIIQRGNNKAYIFDQQTDKATFLEQIKKIKAANDFYIYAYVLMDNHYHLLIEMKSDPLNIIMHKLNMSYSKYFNKKYGRVGTIFGGPYKCFPITGKAQFLNTLQYILFNPVQAKIVKSVQDYRWSSHFEMKLNKAPLLAKNRLLWRLDHNKETAEKIYADLIGDGGISPQENLILQENTNSLQIHNSLEIFYKHWSKDSPGRKKICNNNRTKAVVEERKRFVLEALTCEYPVKDIAQFLKCSQRTIRHIREQWNI